MKFFSQPLRRSRPLRSTLLELHTTGVVSVFRRHSLLRLWVPLRENFLGREDLLG